MTNVGLGLKDLEQGEDGLKMKSLQEEESQKD